MVSRDDNSRSRYNLCRGVLPHFLLSHPNPESILVFGGGAGGVIHEILKHPSVKTADYVEIDPQFLITVKKIFDSIIPSGFD